MTAVRISWHRVRISWDDTKSSVHRAWRLADANKRVFSGKSWAAFEISWEDEFLMVVVGASSQYESPWQLFTFSLKSVWSLIVQARILAYKATETNFSWFKLKAHSWSGKDTAMAVPGPDCEDCPVGPTDTEPWEWPLELLSLPLKGDDWLYLLATPIPAWIPRDPFCHHELQLQTWGKWVGLAPLESLEVTLWGRRGALIPADCTTAP